MTTTTAPAHHGHGPARQRRAAPPGRRLPGREPRTPHARHDRQGAGAQRRRRRQRPENPRRSRRGRARIRQADPVPGHPRHQGGSRRHVHRAGAQARRPAQARPRRAGRRSGPLGRDPPERRHLPPPRAGRHARRRRPAQAARGIGIPALLYGPPGTGKTSLVEAAFGDEVITVAGDGDTTTGDLVGDYTQRDEAGGSPPARRPGPPASTPATGSAPGPETAPRASATSPPPRPRRAPPAYPPRRRPRLPAPPQPQSRNPAPRRQGTARSS